MSFDENMGNVNWRMVRLISNFGYKFMPKAKGVSFKKYRGDTFPSSLISPLGLGKRDFPIF